MNKSRCCWSDQILWSKNDVVRIHAKKIGRYFLEKYFIFFREIENCSALLKNPHTEEENESKFDLTSHVNTILGSDFKRTLYLL